MDFTQCQPYLKEEILRLDKELNRFGLHALLGQEIEFDRADDESRKHNAESLRAKAQEFLAEELRNTPDTKMRQQIQEKSAALKKFSASDLLMFSLVEMNPETREYLKPAFGRSEYTDHPEICELRMRPLPPEKWIIAREAVLRALRKGGEELGIPIVPSVHLSISISHNDKNIFSLDNPSYPFLTGRVLEGITRAVFDARGIFATSRSNQQTPVECGPSRGSFLRVCRDRVELRLGSNKQDFVDYTRAFTLMSGALFGIMQEHYEQTSSYHSSQTILRHETRFKPIFAEGTNIGQPEYAKHMFGGSVFDSSGHLQLDEGYLSRCSYAIATELFDEKQIPKEYAILTSLLLPNILNEIHVSKQHGKYVFVGSSGIDPVLHVLVDKAVRTLNSELPIKDVIEVPLICPGYNNVINESLLPNDAGTPPKAVYGLRFRSSPVFRRVTDPNVFEALNHACLTEFGKPSASDRLYNQKLEQLNASIQEQAVKRQGRG